MFISTQQITQPHLHAARIRSRLSCAQTVEELGSLCNIGVTTALREIGLTRENVTRANFRDVKAAVIDYVNSRAKRDFKSNLDRIIGRVLLTAVGHHLAAGGTEESAAKLKIVCVLGDYVDRGGLRCGVPAFPAGEFKEALARISSEVSLSYLERRAHTVLIHFTLHTHVHHRHTL